MFTLAELRAMSQFGIGDISGPIPVDIKSVTIDPTESIVRRMESFLEQIKNPYCFSCENTTVKVSFSDGAKPLCDLLAEHFIRRRTG